MDARKTEDGPAEGTAKCEVNSKNENGVKPDDTPKAKVSQEVGSERSPTSELTPEPSGRDGVAPTGGRRVIVRVANKRQGTRVVAVRDETDDVIGMTEALRRAEDEAVDDSGSVCVVEALLDVAPRLVPGLGRRLGADAERIADQRLAIATEAAISAGGLVRLRALSNVESFLRVHRDDPELIWSLVTAGLTRVGFGIDGATPEVWRAIRKPHGGTGCAEAIAVARETYGITPEALMVVGHRTADTRESLDAAFEFARAMHDQFGAVPRPHVAKDFVPGSDGWLALTNHRVIVRLLETPALFQVLDFTALPSSITHPDAELRALVTGSVRRLCDLPECVTRYVLPEDEGLSSSELSDVRAFNRGRYDV